MKAITPKQVCCNQMKHCLKDIRVAVYYDPVFREYYICVLDWHIPKDEIYSLYDICTAQQEIDYCPWCGIKLPVSLRDKYFDILENEYNLDVDIFSIKDNLDIPEEFKSDEWWKKRGL